MIGAMPAKDRDGASALICVGPHRTIASKKLAARPNQGITRVNLSPRMRLDDVVKRISNRPFEATDCALPMIRAGQQEAPAL